MENYTVKEGKALAVVAYLWWIGLIIAFIVNLNKKNPFTSFHVRQALGLNIASIAAGLVSEYISGTVGWILGVIVIVLFILAILYAIQGKEKTVPVIGDLFQDWFKTLQ
ncbi:MAG TPA: hypothetical protein VJ970_02105 [Flavobacteriaceae bacterium]|nr:hypothetical protein [Flavobacteriaceae bacterium]